MAATGAKALKKPCVASPCAASTWNCRSRPTTSAKRRACPPRPTLTTAYRFDRGAIQFIEQISSVDYA
jgi:hypothetical protein